MNCMLLAGYESIQEIRNPTFSIQGIQSDFEYHRLLVRALFLKNLIDEFAVIVRRIK